MQWEYMFAESEIGVYKGKDCTGPFLKRLNELGEKGWEAVGLGIDSIVSYTRPVVVLLKRPVKS